MFEDRLN